MGLVLFLIILNLMRKLNQHPSNRKTEIYNLPLIKPAKSLPHIPPVKDFDLRLVNIPMKSYQPQKDKFLSQFFERQTRLRAASSSTTQINQHKSLKTQPPAIIYSKKKLQVVDRPSVHRKSNKNCVTQGNIGIENLKQISKQQFTTYLQSMKQKINKNHIKI